MNDQSRTSRRTIFGVSRNVISSPEAGSGASPPASQDGPTSGLSGRAHAPAKAKASPANASEPMIQGICGRTFIGSSVPDGPLSSWENRLRLRLARIGSTESALIWRTKVTPHGRSISRLAPSTRHINGNDCIGSRWTTTTTRDWKDSAGMATVGEDGRSRMDQLPRQMVGYSARPRASDGEKGGPNMSFGAGGSPLPTQMHSYNPTPTVADVQGGRKARSGARSSEPLLNGLLAAYSPTPTLHGNFSAANGAKGCSPKAGNGLCTHMTAYAPTPQARDGMPPHKLEYIEKHKANGHGMSNLNDYVVHHYETGRSGPTTNGSSAPLTEKRGAPNPEFPFWLMGFPDEWTFGALEAMRSFRKSRQKSSPPISTPKPRRRIM